MPRVLIAGTNSGCGKTTVTTALLSAFKARGTAMAAFKCGPDYIDPMFHREALGIPSRNLDPYFCSREQLRAQAAKAGDALAVMEGVMGYYDGIGTDGRASTYTVAQATETPVILVISAKGMYTSAGAMLRGFREFRPDSNIRGVIFNGISPMVYSGLKQIALDAGVQPLGCLPSVPEITVGSRHLGLITAAEIEDLQERLRKLGELAEKNLDLDGILALAQTAPALPAAAQEASVCAHARIALARDEAFCFLYQENLEMMQSLGAQIVEFSPLHDAALPENIQGLYLPGGYPELYIPQLSANRSMLRSIRDAIASGLPTIAECGGFLYLHRTLDGMEMVGTIAADAVKTARLQRFGYLELIAREDSLLAKKGDAIRSHEFHYYDSGDYGEGFLSVKASNAKQLPCCHVSPSLYAGFPHLYFPANPDFARNFVRKAAEFAAGGTL